MASSDRGRAHRALRSGANWVQLAKFCVVGATGYVVNLVVYTIALRAGAHYLLAATISFLFAATSNYYWNRRWTFHDRHRHAGVQGLQFLVVSAAALTANLLVLDLLVELGLGEKPAQAIAIVVATPLNFLGNRLWSFRTLRRDG